MNEGEFRRLLEKYLLPLLPGTHLGKTRLSTLKHKLVAYKSPIAIVLKPSKTANYRLELLRSQRFATEEKRLVEIFGQELAGVLDQSEASYFDDLMSFLPRRVISTFLPGTRGRSTLERAIHLFETMASQSYEGRPVVASLGISGSILGPGPVLLDELWREDFARALSNGFDSMYLCSSNARVFNIASLPTPRVVGYAPNRLGPIADWCNNEQRVAVVLNRSGEVLVFKDRRLQFAKRRGSWRYYAHETVVSRLRVGTKSLRRAVYESCIDVSFGRAGGCLAVLAAGKSKRLARKVHLGDLITDQKHTRTRLVSRVTGRPFQRLDRRLRQQLLSMDGAVVLKHSGEILAAGSIIKVPSGSTGGGRTAAARALSSLGLGIKISADGPITGFQNRQEVFRL